MKVGAEAGETTGWCGGDGGGTETALPAMRASSLASLDEDGLEFDEKCCTTSSPAVDDPDITPKLDPAVAPEASRRSNRAARAGQLPLTAAREHGQGELADRSAVAAHGTGPGERGRARGTNATAGRRPGKAARRQLPPLFPPAGGSLVAAVDGGSGGDGSERRRREG